MERSHRRGLTGCRRSTRGTDRCRERRRSAPGVRDRGVLTGARSRSVWRGPRVVAGRSGAGRGIRGSAWRGLRRSRSALAGGRSPAAARRCACGAPSPAPISRIARQRRASAGVADASGPGLPSRRWPRSNGAGAAPPATTPLESGAPVKRTAATSGRRTRTCSSSSRAWDCTRCSTEWAAPAPGMSLRTSRLGRSRPASARSPHAAALG